MKTDSFRYSKLIPSVHIDRNSSATQVLWLLLAMARGTASKDYEVGECDPGIEYIALRTELSRSTVERALKRLAQLGLVTTKVRGTVNNHQSSLYRLDYDRLTELVEVCRETEERNMQAIRDKDASKKRRQRAARPSPDDRDKEGDVPVTEGTCPRHDEVMSPSNDVHVPVTERECPRHGDVLTTMNYGRTSIRTNVELAPDAQDVDSKMTEADDKMESSIDQSATSGPQETGPAPVDPVQARPEPVPSPQEYVWLVDKNIARWERNLKYNREKGLPTDSIERELQAAQKRRERYLARCA